MIFAKCRDGNGDIEREKTFGSRSKLGPAVFDKAYISRVFFRRYKKERAIIRTRWRKKWGKRRGLKYISSAEASSDTRRWSGARLFPLPAFKLFHNIRNLNLTANYASVPVHLSPVRRRADAKIFIVLVTKNFTRLAANLLPLCSLGNVFLGCGVLFGRIAPDKERDDSLRRICFAGLGMEGLRWRFRVLFEEWIEDFEDKLHRKS